MKPYRSSKWLALALCLALTAGLFAGCSKTQQQEEPTDQPTQQEQTTEDYTSQISSATSAKEETLTQLEKELESISDITTTEEASATVKQMQDTRTYFENLSKMEAPQEYASAQEKIKTGSEDVLAYLDAAIATAEKKGELSTFDPEDAESIQRYQSDVKDLTSQMEAAKEKYDSGLALVEEGLSEISGK